MGKYERSLKQVQLKNYVAENEMDKALDLVEDMMRDKVTDISDLRMYAEVYYKCGVYDRARELYYRVCDELPTRRNLYRLIVICAKGGYIDEAEKLLAEYVEKDGESVNRYVLRYRIDAAAGASQDVLIRDLEVINDIEYIEKWAYELIKLYYKAGMTEECVAECRHMITWFSEGELVNKIRKLLNHLTEGKEQTEEPAAQEPTPEPAMTEPLSAEELIKSVTFDIPAEEHETEPAAELVTEPATEPATETPAEEAAATLFEETQIEEAPVDETPAEAAPVTGEAPSDEIAEVKLPDDVISLGDFPEEAKEEENRDEEIKTEEIATEPEVQFSKFADDIPYIHDRIFFSSAENININKLSFVIATEKSEKADKTVQRIAKIIRKIKGGKMRIAKISAEKINSIDFEKEIENLDGACVLIENASEISSKTINSIIKMIELYPDKAAIILMDTEESLSRMFFREQILKNQMAHFIYIN